MEVAKLQVSGAKATVINKKIITAGMVGAHVHIDYTGPEWDNLHKTVVFSGVETKDVITDDPNVNILPECIAKPITFFRIGVYGVNADNNLVIPTLWANIGPVLDAADPSGDTSVDPSLPALPKLLAQVGEAANRAEQSEESAKHAAATAIDSATYAQESAEDASRAKEAAEAAKNEAVQSAENAKTSADAAAQAALDAEASVQGGKYIFFDIGPDGHLYLDKSEDAEIDFHLENGRLIATL